LKQFDWKAHERIGKIFNKNARGKNQVVIAGKKGNLGVMFFRWAWDQSG